MITELPQAIDLEIEALKQGRTMTEVCREAGISPTVFHRWKKQMQDPKISSVERLVAALNAYAPTLPKPPDAA